MRSEESDLESNPCEDVLALDVCIDGGWSRITVVTPTRFAVLGLKADPDLHSSVMRQFRDRAQDPIEVLKKSAHLGHGPKIANLAEFKEVNWYEDSKAFTLRIVDAKADVTT